MLRFHRLRFDLDDPYTERDFVRETQDQEWPYIGSGEEMEGAVPPFTFHIDKHACYVLDGLTVPDGDFIALMDDDYGHTCLMPGTLEEFLSAFSDWRAMKMNNEEER